MQDVAIGVDPGSKFEGYTVKSEMYTFLNVQTNARYGIMEAMESRAYARGARRARKTPYRECRPNRHRNKGFIPPSIKARWDWRLNIINFLCRLFPVTAIVVENVAAATRKDINKTKYVKNHNQLFSWVQNGKNWFAAKLAQLNKLIYFIDGFNTYQMRTQMNLYKNKTKNLVRFDTHCVDSWVLASYAVGCNMIPDNLDILHMSRINYQRRQLHVFQPAKGGIRRDVGGTVSLGVPKGTLVKHPKYGVALVGGSSNDRISLHSTSDYSRLCQNAKPDDCKVITKLPYRIKHYLFRGLVEARSLIYTVAKIPRSHRGTLESNRGILI
jgi:hypothetical protein